MEKYITKRAIIWISLGIFALIVRSILSAYPEIIEQYYSRGLFLLLRWLFDYPLQWVPIPLLYLFFLFLGIILFQRFKKFRKSEGKWYEKTTRAITSILAFWSGIIFFFLFLWGFNYGRVSLDQQLELDLQALSKEDLWKELQWETQEIKKWRTQIPKAGDAALGQTAMPAKLGTQLRNSLEEWLATQGYPTTGKVRGRLLYPKGIFLRFSSSGLYFPLTGEGHIDAGLHPLQIPYVMAHEMGHGYGFGDEGTCNFLGYMATTRANDPFLKYAGHLSYWRTLAVNYRRYAPEEYQSFRDSLPIGIQADLDAINEVLLSYPDIMPRMRYAAYNSYLKAQGIKEGMKNYSRVLMLVKAWRERETD